MKKMKNKAMVDNYGRFDKEFDMAGTVGAVGLRGFNVLRVKDFRRDWFLHLRHRRLHEEDEQQCHCRQLWPLRQRDRHGRGREYCGVAWL